MPTPVTTRFTKWEFTQAELFTATRLSQPTLMLIQSLIADAALRRTNLKYTPEDPLNFAQQEAEITGEMGAYEHLLMLATETQMPGAAEEQSKADISKPVSQPSKG